MLAKGISTIFHKQRSYWVLALCYALGIVLLNWPVRHYLLQDDGISGLWEIQQGNKLDFLYSYGYKSLYQFHYLSLLIFKYFFGTDSVYYFIFFALLHGCIGALIARFINHLFVLVKVPHSIHWALILSLLFISSPHIFEHITWAGPSHYGFCMLFYILMLNLLVRYLATGHLSYFYFFSLYILSLFTLEISVLFPISFACLIILCTTRQAVKQSLLKIILPQFLFIAIAYLLLYLLSQVWIPHGMSSNDMLHSFSLYSKNFGHLLSRVLLYSHFLEWPWRDQWYTNLAAFHWLITAGFFAFIFTMLRKRKRIIVFFLFNGIVLFLPFIFRAQSIVNQYENVRFFYFSFLFFQAALLLFIYEINIKFSFVLAVVCILLNLATSYKGVQDKKVNGEVHTAFVNALSQYNATSFTLLNVPSFSKGHFVFRADNRVGIAMQMQGMKNPVDSFKEIVWYYAASPRDSFELDKIDAQTIKIIPRTPGVWIMDEDRGATSYENDKVKVEVGEWGVYTVKFKQTIKEDELILLFSNGRFRPVEL